MFRSKFYSLLTSNCYATFNASLILLDFLLLETVVIDVHYYVPVLYSARSHLYPRRKLQILYRQTSKHSVQDISRIIGSIRDFHKFWFFRVKKGAFSLRILGTYEVSWFLSLPIFGAYSWVRWCWNVWNVLCMFSYCSFLFLFLPVTASLNVWGLLQVSVRITWYIILVKRRTQ